MKKIILYMMVLFAVVACEPRIGLDETQWDMSAEITDMFIYRLQQDEIELADGSKVMGTKKVTVSSGYEVDSENATVEITLKPETDRTALSCYIYHTGKSVEPVDGTPTPGILADWSASSYKFRIYQADGEFKEWTVTIK